MKLPRIRKANVRSNINDLMNDPNDEDRVEFDNNDFFFDSQFNSYYFNRNESPEVRRKNNQRLKRIKFWLLAVSTILIVLVILIFVIRFFNPYGVREIMIGMVH